MELKSFENIDSSSTSLNVGLMTNKVLTHDLEYFKQAKEGRRDFEFKTPGRTTSYNPYRSCIFSRLY